MRNSVIKCSSAALVCNSNVCEFIHQQNIWTAALTVREIRWPVKLTGLVICIGKQDYSMAIGTMTALAEENIH